MAPTPTTLLSLLPRDDPDDDGYHGDDGQPTALPTSFHTNYPQNGPQSGWNSMAMGTHVAITICVIIFFIVLLAVVAVLSRRRKALRQQNLLSHTQRPYASLGSGSTIYNPNSHPQTHPLSNTNYNAANGTGAGAEALPVYGAEQHYAGAGGLPQYNNAGGLGMRGGNGSAVGSGSGSGIGTGSEFGESALDVPPPVYEPRGHSLDEESGGLVADGKMPLSERLT